MTNLSHVSPLRHVERSETSLESKQNSESQKIQNLDSTNFRHSETKSKNLYSIATCAKNC